MKRLPVLVTILLTLSGLLIGSKVSSFAAAQPIPEYVPVSRPMRVAQPVSETIPSFASLPVKAIEPTPPSQYGHFTAPIAVPMSQESIGAILDTADEELPLPPSLPEGYFAVPPVSYCTVPISVPSSASNDFIGIDWTPQASSVVSEPMSYSIAIPSRFQMAMERTANSENVTVVVCDTTNGQCWSSQAGSTEWVAMGSPNEPNHVSDKSTKSTKSEECSAISAEVISTSSQTIKSDKDSADWNALLQF